MSNKHRIQTYLPGEYIEALDHIAEKYSLSRSRMICDIVGQKLTNTDDMSKAVEEALDDDLLRIARKRREDELLRDRQEEIEKKASYEDRVRGYFRKRLEGDQAYSPEMQAELAEGYKQEATIWFDDDAEADKRQQWVDEQMEVYRAGYYARKHADSIDAELQPHNRNKSWMDIGDDLYRLRSRQDEVYQWVRQRADNSGTDYKDTVVEYVCQEWSVGKAAVLLFLEQLVDDPDKNVKTMLRQGGAVMADQEALGVGSSLSELSGSVSEQVVEVEAEPVESDTDQDVDADRDGVAADRDGSEQVVDVEPVESETDQDVDDDRRPESEADRSEVEASAPASTDGGAHSDTVGDFTAEELAPDHLIQTAEELLRGGEEPHMVELELRRETATDTQRKCALEAARQRVEQADAEQAVSGSVAAVGGEADE